MKESSYIVPFEFVGVLATYCDDVCLPEQALVWIDDDSTQILLKKVPRMPSDHL
jgi:hypothetical protein